MCDAIVGSRRGMARVEIEIKIGKSSEVVKTFGDFFVLMEILGCFDCLLIIGV